VAYVRQVGSRWKCEVRVTKKGFPPLTANEMHDSELAATQWGREKEDEFRAQMEGGHPTKTVRQLMVRFRDEEAPSRDGSKWDINRINQFLARWEPLGYNDLNLKAFTNVQMAKIRRSRLLEIAPNSVKREEALLRTIWARARHPDWHWTDVDPFKDLGPIKGGSGKPRDRKAAWPELKRILRELGYHPRRPEANKKAEVGLAMLLALRTTLRSQEVLAMSDDAVDLRRLIIEIEKHKTRHKTNEAKVVPLMPKALLLLARKCLGKGRYFTVATGSRDTFYRNARALAGVDDLRFHDLKRTSILLIKDKLKLDEILSVTGNKDAEVLRRHYLKETAAEAAKIVWSTLGFNREQLLQAAGVAA
jgi:hypothetical protein